MQRPRNDALGQGGLLFSAVSKRESLIIEATYQRDNLRGDTISASYCHADLAWLSMGAEAARRNRAYGNHDEYAAVTKD